MQKRPRFRGRGGCGFAGASSNVAAPSQSLADLLSGTPSSSRGPNQVQVHSSNAAASEREVQGSSQKRKDTPPVSACVRASKARALAAAADPVLRRAAWDNYQKEKSSSSAVTTRQSQLSTWVEFHCAWFGTDDSFPLTADSIAGVSCLFKAGGYRGFPNYLSRAKEAHIAAGFAWTEQLALEERKSRHSVSRGQGPPRQSACFDLCRLFERGAVSDSPAEAPVMFVEACVVACFWMLREIELAHLMHADVRVDSVLEVATLRLSVSKTDPQAFGCDRSWGCVCGNSSPQPCGYHAVVASLAFNCKHFSERGSVRPGLPLFPTGTGGICSKEGIIKSLELHVGASGGAIALPCGRRKFGGHSFRVTGAQRLAAMGIELMVIMCLARWGSGVILRYVQEAPLAKLTDKFRLLSDTGEKQGDLDKLSFCIHSLVARLDSQGSGFEALRRELVEHSAKLAALEEAAKGFSFVVNSKSQVGHRVLCDGADLPPGSWRTRCGWHFANAAHFRCRELKNLNLSAMCAVCFPGAPPEGVAGDSSSDSSSSCSS